jgi:NADH:ubiquinone oxidoreductase subunit K
VSLVGPLLLGAFIFCVGVYGVISRRNSVLVLMSVELMLNAVNVNFVAFHLVHHGTDPFVTGHVFALFVITVAAAEVGVGLAIVLNMFRNRASVNVDDADLMRW